MNWLPKKNIYYLIFKNIINDDIEMLEKNIIIQN